MGLGLAIVERACHMLEHDLELVSTLGKGTLVRVSVPYAQHQSLTFATCQVEKPIDDFPPNLIAMIVENDDEVREAMNELLEGWGISTILATNFQTACDALEALGMIPDVFFVDYQLDNDENGIALIENIRKRYAPAPAILLTANREHLVQAEAVGKGIFVRYKPVDTNELRQLALRLLKNEKHQVFTQ